MATQKKRTEDYLESKRRLLPKGSVFNITDYNAVVDTDCSTAVQAAIDAAAVSGGIVEVPPVANGSSYLVNGLVPKDGVTIMGLGPRAEVDSPYARFENTTANGTMFVSSGTKDFQISNMSLVGTTSDYILDLTNPERCVFEKCQIGATLKDNIRFTGCWDIMFRDVRFGSGVDQDYADVHLTGDDSRVSNQTLFDRCNWENIKRTSLKVINTGSSERNHDIMMSFCKHEVDASTEPTFKIIHCDRIQDFKSIGSNAAHLNLSEISADGTATGGADTTTLIDSGATFVTDVVAVDDVVFNDTQGEFVTVVSIDSETQLTCTALGSGTWNGDDYKINRPGCYLYMEDSLNAHLTDVTYYPGRGGTAAKPGHARLVHIKDAGRVHISGGRTQMDGSIPGDEIIGYYGTATVAQVHCNGLTIDRNGWTADYSISLDTTSSGNGQNMDRLGGTHKIATYA